jgi:hypothetical protein
MRQIRTTPTQRNQLRLVYEDKVLSLGGLAEMTYGEIARVLRKRSIRRYGNPVAINVILDRSLFGPEWQ